MEACTHPGMIVFALQAKDVLMHYEEEFAR